MKDERNKSYLSRMDGALVYSKNLGKRKWPGSKKTLPENNQKRKSTPAVVGGSGSWPEAGICMIIGLQTSKPISTLPDVNFGKVVKHPFKSSIVHKAARI